MEQKADITVIIVNWNVRGPIRECLASLQFIEHPAIEVIVVDNASSDGSVEMIRKEFPFVKIIANQNNLGFAKACNQGFRMGEGDYFLLLNPDTEVPRQALVSLLDVARSHPEAGVIGPKILNPDMTVQPSVRQFPSIINQTILQLKLHHLFKGLKPIRDYLMINFTYDQMKEVDQVMGAAFLIPRDVVEAHGGLDEQYFVWYEEVDFCRKVKMAGRPVLFTPNTYIIHKQGQSFFQLVSSNRQRMMNESLRKYMYKNHGWFAGAWFTLLHPISMGLAYTSQWAGVKPKAL